MLKFPPFSSVMQVRQLGTGVTVNQSGSPGWSQPLTLHQGQLAGHYDKSAANAFSNHWRICAYASAFHGWVQPSSY